jgi:hypothetical protein
MKIKDLPPTEKEIIFQALAYLLKLSNKGPDAGEAKILAEGLVEARRRTDIDDCLRTFDVQNVVIEYWASYSDKIQRKILVQRGDHTEYAEEYKHMALIPKTALPEWQRPEIGRPIIACPLV